MFLRSRNINSRYRAMVLIGLVISILLFFRVADRIIESGHRAAAYVNTGRILQSGEIQPALSLLFSRVLSRERQNMLAWNTGFIAVSTDQLKMATVAWEFLDDDTQGHLSAMLLDLIKEYEAMGKVKEAAQLLAGWVSLAPSDWSRYDYQGNFYLRHDQTEMAGKVFSLGARITDGAGSSYLAGRASEMSGEWTTARYHYEQALRGNDADVIFHFRLAVLLNLRFHDPQGAIHVCQEAVRRAPENYACYEQLGIIHLSLQDFEAARSWYARGYDNVSKPSYRSLFIERLLEIARHYEEMGNQTQALATYQMILQRDANNDLAVESISQLSRRRQ